MEVVEHEHERLRGRQSFEQLAHRAVTAVALVLKRSSAGCHEPRQRGKDERELMTHVVVEGLKTMRLETLDVLVERFHEHPER